MQVFYLLNREMPVNLEEITGALRALHVVDLLARGDGFGNADDLRDPLNAAIVLPEANVRIAPETPPERPRVREQQERHKVERQHFTALWGRYQRQGSSIARAARFQSRLSQRRSIELLDNSRWSKVSRSAFMRKTA